MGNLRVNLAGATLLRNNNGVYFDLVNLFSGLDSLINLLRRMMNHHFLFFKAAIWFRCLPLCSI